MLDARQRKFFIIAFLLIILLVYAVNNLTADDNSPLMLVGIAVVVVGLPWSIGFAILEEIILGGPASDLSVYLGAAVNVYILVRLLVKKQPIHVIQSNQNKRF